MTRYSDRGQRASWAAIYGLAHDYWALLATGAALAVLVQLERWLA